MTCSTANEREFVDWSNHQSTASPCGVPEDGSVLRRDQATELRYLIEQQGKRGPAGGERHVRCRTLSVASGKGGVGKSIVSLNLAIALSQADQRVALLDGNLGLGNLDLMCGLNGYWNLTHVVAGARRLEDVILKVPGGPDLIPGASGLADAADLPLHVQQELLRKLQEIEEHYDWIVIDTGSGIHRLVRNFVSAGRSTLLVSTLEPTSLADAYATIKSLAGDGATQVQVVLNRVQDEDKAQHAFERLNSTSQLFLRQGVRLMGRIPDDAAVARSVERRSPLQVAEPDSPAAKALRRIAQKLMETPAHQADQTSFFEGFWSRFRAEAA